MPLAEMNAFVTFLELHCIEEGDGPGEAEPYLWTIFFRVDGTSLSQAEQDLFRLTGDVGFHFNQGSHGNLTSLSAGEGINVPLATWNTKLKPIVLKGLGEDIEIPGLIGVIAILMEEDIVTDDAAEAGHHALNEFVSGKIQGFVDDLNLSTLTNAALDLKNATGIPLDQGRLQILGEMVEAFKDQLVEDAKTTLRDAIVGAQTPGENFGSFLNGDDFIGVGMKIVDQQTLLGQAPTNLWETNHRSFASGGVNFSFDLQEDAGVLQGGGLMGQSLGRFVLDVIVGWKRSWLKSNVRAPEGDRVEVSCCDTGFASQLNVRYVQYVGGKEGTRPWRLHKFQVHDLITSGAKAFFVRSEDGSEVEIIARIHEITGTPYIQTVATNIETDNLLSLPACEPFVALVEET